MYKISSQRKFSAAVYKYDDDSRMIKKSKQILILNTSSKRKDNLKGDDNQFHYYERILDGKK